jgi:hypothetical protein
MRIFFYLALVLSGNLFDCCNLGRADEIVTNSASSTNEGQSFEPIMKLFEKKHFYAVDKLYQKKLGVYTLVGSTLKQRNTIFLLVAKSLVTTNNTHGTNSIGIHRIELDWEALELLNRLNEDNSITTPEVIPYLIEALDISDVVPRIDYSGIIIQILGKMTKHETGYVNGDDHFFQRNHKAIMVWWRTWWQENKDKHPVLDADLEKTLRDEILKIDEEIKQAKLTPNFWWDGSASHEILDRDINFWDGDKDFLFTFYYGHSPGFGARGAEYFSYPSDDVLYLRGDFLTKDFQEKDQSNNRVTLSGKEFPMQEIFHKTVKDTDIEIKVEIATTNTALINVLQGKLNK